MASGGLCVQLAWYSGTAALWLQTMCEEVYAAVVCNHLRDHLVQRTQRTFDEHILSSALEYSTTVPLQFLDLLLSQQVGAAGSPGMAARAGRSAQAVAVG